MISIHMHMQNAYVYNMQLHTTCLPPSLLSMSLPSLALMASLVALSLVLVSTNVYYAPSCDRLGGYLKGQGYPSQASDCSGPGTLARR